VKVGGRQAGRSQGIHWHVDPDHVVRYRSDESRRTIYEVEVETKGGKQRFASRPLPRRRRPRPPSGGGWTASTATTGRPTSTATPIASSTPPSSTGGIDPTLPFVRREGLKALLAEYPSHEAAREGIATAIAGFYAQSHPQVASEKKDAVAAAGRALGDIWCWNVFPKMNIKWGTYKNHIGHALDMSGEIGCFRCHDEEHKTAEGKTISQDCTTCTRSSPRRRRTRRS